MNVVEDKKYRWIPNLGIGDINFKLSKSNLAKCLYKKHENDIINDSTGWETYTLSDPNFELSFEADELVAIQCLSKFYYKNQNIINQKIDKILSFFKKDEKLPVFCIQKDEVELCDTGVHDVYDLLELGLQLWVKNGKVISICLLK